MSGGGSMGSRAGVVSQQDVLADATAPGDGRAAELCLFPRRRARGAEGRVLGGLGNNDLALAVKDGDEAAADIELEDGELRERGQHAVVGRRRQLGRRRQVSGSRGRIEPGGFAKRRGGQQRSRTTWPGRKTSRSRRASRLGESNEAMPQQEGPEEAPTASAVTPTWAMRTMDEGNVVCGARKHGNSTVWGFDSTGLKAEGPGLANQCSTPAGSDEAAKAETPKRNDGGESGCPRRKHRHSPCRRSDTGRNILQLAGTG
ncbi:hypothetical protein Micbo1qcDRAFT_226178 [Microdochium bolleyi]|uniref:Uncharacterized protein n=1 Tax=Microdochium bolleyi TaxID=196109 RepID=A0A136IIR5_9PEZI|nr:hypothetical protein Micbo1qcDRAFT_226178 [Microdochium bolleyi]